MDTSRLLTVLLALHDEFESGYWSSVVGLTKAFQQARNEPTTDHSDLVAGARETFEQTVSASRVNEMVPSQLAIFEKIGAARFFGPGAQSEFSDILTDVNLGHPAVASRLEAFQKALSDFNSHTTQVIDGLEVMAVKPAILEGNQFEIGVLIPRSVVDGRLKNVNQILDEWNDILRFLLELGDAPNREVNLRELSTGSFDFFAEVPIEWTAAAVAVIVERLAKAYTWVLETKLLRRQLTEKGVPASEPETIKEHERKRFEDEIESLQKDLIADSPAKIDKGRVNELGNALTWAIRQIARQLDRGVTIEVSFPPLPVAEIPLEADADGIERSLTERREVERKRAAAVVAGAAAANLPERVVPILQLGPPEPPPKETKAVGKPDTPLDTRRQAAKKKST